MIAKVVDDKVVYVLEDNDQVMYRGASILASKAAEAPAKTGYFPIVSTHTEAEKPYRYTINMDTLEVTYSKTHANWEYTEYPIRIKAKDTIFMLPVEVSYFFIQWINVSKLRELPIIQNHLPHTNHLYINEFDPPNMRVKVESLAGIGWKETPAGYVVGPIADDPDFLPIFGELESGSLVTINDIEEWL